MLAELVQMITSLAPEGIPLLPWSGLLLPPRAYIDPKASMILLAFLTACGILAQGTDQA